jgi:hypothetical protein
MHRTDLDHERWALVFLARLARLCHLEERFVSSPDVVEDPQRLVQKAIFATYCDCISLGCKAEAERLLAPRSPRRGPADASLPPGKDRPLAA